VVDNNISGASGFLRLSDVCMYVCMYNDSVRNSWPKNW